MNTIIKNKVALFGNADLVDSIVKGLKNERGQIDFNKIEPMNEDSDDIAIDEYTNLCMNVYLRTNAGTEEEAEKIINMFEFISTTRNEPDTFKVLTDVQINSARSHVKSEQLIKDIEKIIERIKSKAIFNGYLIRDALWGTGSGPKDSYVKHGNTLVFDTYNQAPILLFKKLSEKYSDIRIEYTYYIDGKVTRAYIKNGDVKFDYDENKEYHEDSPFSLITEYVCL